jgi:hypothetical protein
METNCYICGVGSILQKGFRNKLPKLCRLSGPARSKLEPFPYRDVDVKVVKAYASSSAGQWFACISKPSIVRTLKPGSTSRIRGSWWIPSNPPCIWTRNEAG